MICLISFSRFSKVLPAFNWARATANLWSICLEVNILKHEIRQLTYLDIHFQQVALDLAVDVVKEWSFYNLITASHNLQSNLILQCTF